jgi:hypothetical protein
MGPKRDDLEKNPDNELEAVIATAQRKYRIYYETCIEACRKKDDFACELLILINGPPEIPEQYRLWRCDAIWRQDGRPQPGQFELDPPEKFDPLTAKHPSGFNVTVHPFVWHACEVYFKAPTDSWIHVEEWRKKWLDENDKNPRDKFGLAGVIHWFSQPSRAGDSYANLIDLGSTPPNSLHELLFALGEDGARDVTIASFDYPTSANRTHRD